MRLVLLLFLISPSVLGKDAYVESFRDRCYPRDPFFCDQMSSGWLYNPFTKTCAYYSRACAALIYNYNSACMFCATGKELDAADLHPGSHDHRPVNIPNSCMLDEDNGEIYGLISMMIRWRYSPIKKRCIEFKYHGCMGNENNYATQTDCHSECSSRRK